MFEVKDMFGTLVALVSADEMSIDGDEFIFERVIREDSLTRRSFVRSVPMAKGMSVCPVA